MRLRFAALACALACAIGTDALAQAISVNPGRSSNGVSLQATAPGTRQTGNLHVSGIAQATQFCLWGNAGNCSSYLIETIQLGAGGTGGIGFTTQGNGSAGGSFTFMGNGSAFAAPGSAALMSFGAGQVCNFGNCSKLRIWGDGRIATNNNTTASQAHYLRGGLRTDFGALYVGRSVGTNAALVRWVDETGDIATDGGTGFALGMDATASTALSLTVVGTTGGAALNGTAWTVDRSATPTFTVLGAGLKIGSSGTTISASVENSATWTPGALTAGSSTCVAITLTGATAGATCAYGLPSTYASGAPYCQVAAGSCNVCWQGTASGTPPSGTYRCRAFNP